jgi:RNA polymerase sigma-70 factor (ECF subfamily)
MLFPVTPICTARKKTDARFITPLGYTLCNDMDDETLDSADMLETPESFEAAYRAHSSAVYRFLLWRTKNHQLSEDLTSTTVQKAWVSRKSFKGGSAQAWLYRIARNTLFDYWRKKSELPLTDQSELVVDEQRSAGDAIDTQMEIATLRAALRKLPDDMRNIVELRFIEGLSSKTVAARLGISDGNVRIIQYRALQKLRDYLQ